SVAGSRGVVARTGANRGDRSAGGEGQERMRLSPTSFNRRALGGTLSTAQGVATGRRRRPPLSACRRQLQEFYQCSGPCFDPLVRFVWQRRGWLRRPWPWIPIRKLPIHSRSRLPPEWRWISRDRNK